MSLPASTVAEVVRRSGGCCEAGIHPDCDGAAAHMHHRQLRRHGDNTAANLLAVCVYCHSWIHAHPAAARDFGLIVRSWENPADVKVSS